MNKSLYRILIFLLVVYGGTVTAGADSPGVDCYPRERRLQPMLLPMKMWQVANGFNIYAGAPWRGNVYTHIDPAVLGFAPRRRIAKRVELPRFPYFPYIRILMSEYDIGVRPDGSMNRFATAFEGGITTMNYSDQDGFGVVLNIAMATKLILNERWWHEQCIEISAAEGAGNNQSFIRLAEMAGCQLSEKVALSTVMGGGIMPEYKYFQSSKIFGVFGMHLFANLSKRFSFAVGGSVSCFTAVHGAYRHTPYIEGRFYPRLIIQW